MAALTQQDVVSSVRQHRERIRGFGVTRLGLFGSFVRDEQHHDSDVDVLVEFLPGKKTFDNFLELCSFLEDLLGRRVEALTRESLSPHIGPRILDEVQYVSLDG